jgi:hypothetical protein
MNKLILLFCLMCLLFSCNKEDKPLTDYTNILAGDSISEGIIYVNIPDTILQSDCSRDFFASCGTAEIYQMDLNQDDSIDYEIELFLMMETGYGDTPGFLTASILITPLQINNKISIEDGLYSSVRIHSEGDTVNKNLNWTGDLLVHNLISLYVDGYTNEIPEYNYDTDSWAGKMDQYIGLQMVETSDTLYGWLRLDVYDVYKIAIKDFAYRRK